ncbi:glycosyltransferase [Candidatus Gottesmanbacteria bacterium]|nr:glycosyltransferase [Candidatus Gottesmanbacteria bacterium]
MATTEPTALWAKKTCPWTKIITIPYGIDGYKNIKPVKLNLEKPIFLCPAAAVEYKRVDLAIKALAKLGKGSLLYLGTGPLLPALNALGKKLLGKRYLNLTVSYEEMPKYYAAGDVVTLPSSSQENSPMTFLEAMASGKITVVTDAPRPRWILGEAGIYVDPTDITAYAAALQQAINFKNKKVISLQVQKYSWQKIVPLYEDLLQE